jgi:2-Cys peroxiredoxin 5
LNLFVKTHLPGFIKNIDQVHEKGYEVVACVTVNDAFVTGAWGQNLNATGKVRSNLVIFLIELVKP